ncbi:unnamed protein product [Urochloa humidicola]
MVDDDLPEALVQAGLRPELMPRHVAFVLDGNRRWAQARGLTTLEGYEAGAQALKKTIELSFTWGIRAITVFAMSLENFFGRPEILGAINFMMELIEPGIRDQIGVLEREGVRVRVIGDLSRMQPSVQDAAREVEMTRNNSRYHFTVAICYSGK